MNDMIVKIKQGHMKPEDIPIKQDAAQAFLKSIGNMGTPLPSLNNPSGAKTKGHPGAKTTADNSAAAPGGNAALTQLLNNAQYLKWNIDVSIGFDPNAALRGRMLERLEQIEKTLTNLVISETPPTPQMYSIYRKEIETIQQMLQSQISDNTSTIITDPLPTAYTRFDTEQQAPTEDQPPSANYTRDLSASMPDAVPTNGSLPNGRVSMMGPDRVRGDGRVQLRNMPSPTYTSANDSNYGTATPSENTSTVYTMPPHHTPTCPSPPSSTMFALPMTYGAITPDMMNQKQSSFNAQPSYNTTHTVIPNVNAMYTPPPVATVPVYMTAYSPSLPGVSATASGAQVSKPANFIPTAVPSNIPEVVPQAPPAVTRTAATKAKISFLNTLLANESDPAIKDAIQKNITGQNNFLSMEDENDNKPVQDGIGEYIYAFVQSLPHTYSFKDLQAAYTGPAPNKTNTVYITNMLSDVVTAKIPPFTPGTSQVAVCDNTKASPTCQLMSYRQFSAQYPKYKPAQNTQLQAIGNIAIDYSNGNKPMPVKQFYAIYDSTQKHAMVVTDYMYTMMTKSGQPIPPSVTLKPLTLGHPLTFGASTIEGFESSNSTFPYAGPQADSKIRPGFTMNDASIANRASASAFDPSTIGRADYKQRALELCRQVGQADLAPPDNFGCIAKPDEVSEDYSWKGNYQMVCNRLGDTWGGWYPEMVGCPTPNPTAKFQGH